MLYYCALMEKKKLLKEVIITSIWWGFDQKKQFFEGCSWVKFDNLELALGMTLKFYAIVTKQLKLKVRKFPGRLIPTFLEVIGEKLEGSLFFPIVNKRIKQLEWGVQNGPTKKNGVLPVTILFFSKILFQWQNLIRVDLIMGHDLMHQLSKCPYSYFLKALEFYLRVLFPCEYL